MSHVGLPRTLRHVYSVVTRRVRTDRYPPDCHDPTYGGVGGAWAPGYSICRNTTQACRWAAAVALLLFGSRWLVGRLRTLPAGGRSRRQSQSQMDRPGATAPVVAAAAAAVQCAASFVLEAVGGAGALWGAAEVARTSGSSLRLGWADEHFGQLSFDAWRPWCGGTFALCLARWSITSSAVKFSCRPEGR